MADLLKALTISEVKSKFTVRLDKVYIENSAFRLFSRFTSGAFFICAGLVSLQQLVGKHIDCIVPPKEDVRPEALNQYCFIMGTYTVPDLYNSTVGVEVAHPGVGGFQHGDDGDDSQANYHIWYQWVPIALFFQGIFFLVPHLLWKTFEQEKIKAFCDLEVASSVNLKTRSLTHNSDPEKKQKTISKAAIYFVGTMGYNNIYAYSYIICEWLNLLILILNFFFTDSFLGKGDFLNYGAEVVAYSKLENPQMISPMDRVFPKVSKCDFHKYGPSGGIIRYDVMCVLAINIINEKIYMFLWFWFIILGCIGILAMIYRIVVMFLPGIRNFLLRRKTDMDHKGALDFCLRQMSYSDWFLLKKLNTNINPIRFGELVEGIKSELKKKTVEGRLSSSPLPGYTDSDKSYKDMEEDADLTASFLNKNV